jgi:aryl-alcohol dehydrogenase-like predicted oxidoreductase
MRENISDVLAKEAEEAEQRRDEPTRLVRRARPAREPAQVYSVRMPVDRIEQLRQVAERMGVSPTTLMRAWVLERLDNETPAVIDLAGRLRRLIRDEVRDEIREELERARQA